MKLFGTVKSFDEAKGHGSISPEGGGDVLRFDRSAVHWGDERAPKTERRLSYEVGKNSNGDACAINLRST